MVGRWGDEQALGWEHPQRVLGIYLQISTTQHMVLLYISFAFFIDSGQPLLTFPVPRLRFRARLNRATLHVGGLIFRT